MLVWVPSAFIKNIMNKFVVIIKLFLNIFITFIYVYVPLWVYVM